MKHEADSPAKLMLKQALARAERVSPMDGSHPDYDSLKDQVSDIGHMTAAHLRLTAPMIESYHNGGLPARPAGRLLKFGPFSVRLSGAQVWTFITRITLIATCLCILALLQGMDVSVSTKGLQLKRPVSSPVAEEVSISEGRRDSDRSPAGADDDSGARGKAAAVGVLSPAGR